MKIASGSLIAYNGAQYVLASDIDVEPAVPPQVYPKLLWDKHSVEATARTPAEETSLKAEGFVFDHQPTADEIAALEPAPTDAPAAVEPVAETPASDAVEEFDNEPTFGGPGDDTHEKRNRKNK